MIGTTAAIIGGALAAGGAVGSAAIQAHAAGSARKSQEKATGRSQAILQPYASAGYGALSNLQGLTASGPASQQVAQRLASQGAPTGAPSTLTGAFGSAVPRGQVAQGQGYQPMVTLRAPTGETRRVPLSQSGYLISQGAKMVGQ